MANTYTQMHHQFVFAVQNRISLIQPSWKEDLYKYMTGIIQNHDHKVLAINGMADHVHIFIGMRPTQSVMDLMQDIKGSSSKWINENRLARGKFQWQEGYGAFSYSKSHVPAVINILSTRKYIIKRKPLLKNILSSLTNSVLNMISDIFLSLLYDELNAFRPPPGGCYETVTFFVPTFYP